MSQLPMSNREIRLSYETALEPSKQVKVLAELNATTVTEIVRILREEGVDYHKLNRISGREKKAKKQQEQEAAEPERAVPEPLAQEAAVSEPDAPMPEKPVGLPPVQKLPSEPVPEPVSELSLRLSQPVLSLPELGSVVFDRQERRYGVLMEYVGSAAILLEWGVCGCYFSPEIPLHMLSLCSDLSVDLSVLHRGVE